jgi:hypothetical protein
VAVAEPLEIVAAIRSELDAGVDQVLTEAEACLAALAEVRAGGVAALDRLERGLCAIMEACAFQDLTGQRLAALVALIDPETAPPQQDALLNGPALSGGLDQTAADHLLASPPVGEGAA